MKLYYQTDIKHIVVEHWEWKLVGDFEPVSEYDGKWYALQKRDDGWYIVAKIGCAWDGATFFPDFKWIMQGSLGHDVLLWLIAKGIISESKNDLADKEIFHIIMSRAKFYSQTVLKLLANIVKTGARFVKTKKGKPTYKVEEA